MHALLSVHLQRSSRPAEQSSQCKLSCQFSIMPVKHACGVLDHIHQGYKLKLIMPSNMSEERRSSMAAYGAELISVSIVLHIVAYLWIRH